MTELLQFAGSHYCEKARFALDYKGVEYSVRNLVPGPHAKTARRIAANTSLPVLLDGGATVQGSAAIIDHLDQHYKVPMLTPTNTQDASMARELERYLDHNIGINFRLVFYYYAFADREFISDFLLRGGPWWGRLFFLLAYPGIKRSMKNHMSINKEQCLKAIEQLNYAFDQLDQKVSGKKFLAGSQFSRADLTAASLLFHRFDDDWRAPPGFDAVMAKFSPRPFFRFAESIYVNYRHQHREVRN